MKRRVPFFRAFMITVAVATVVQAQSVERDIPYANPAHERQVLDVYTPENRPEKSCP